MERFSNGRVGEGYRFMKMLQYVKLKSRIWNNVSFGNLKERKTSILKDIVIMDSCEQGGIYLFIYLFDEKQQCYKLCLESKGLSMIDFTEWLYV